MKVTLLANRRDHVWEKVFGYRWEEEAGRHSFKSDGIAITVYAGKYPILIEEERF